jgi:hypothetical protein
MRTKRKRVGEVVTNAKRPKTSESTERGTKIRPLSHSALSFCYSEVHTLRQFLLDSLPSTSRARRRKIASQGLDSGSYFLDTTLVGISGKAKPALEEERRRDFVAFTQSQQRSTHSSTGTPEENHLTEVSFD